MSKAFYVKMAWQNLVKNKKVYIPFLQIGRAHV